MNPKFPVIYGLAGIVLSLLGLAGFQYGAAYLYWPLAIICFSLIVYPTLFAWGLITFAYSTAVLIYIGFTIFELITEGQESTIFSDGIFVYLIYISIIIAIALGLILSKPLLINERPER